MADDHRIEPDFSTENPSVNPKTKTVNPSAPTAGTEGWGNTTDEREALSQNPPSISKDSQTSHSVGDNQAEVSRRSAATATSVSEEGSLGEVHRHGQTEQGWNDWADAQHSRVRDGRAA
jgi:hypothetical protein